MPKGDLNYLPMCQCTDLLICCYVQFTNAPMRQCANRAALYTVGDWPLVHYHHLSNSR
uniref:hypothetical protein n=1 Tax=Phocaeicola vulgatus TaxID=821 RepID=UPI004026B7BF